jgi:hypothetical protein
MRERKLDRDARRKQRRMNDRAVNRNRLRRFEAYQRANARRYKNA